MVRTQSVNVISGESRDIIEGHQTLTKETAAAGAAMVVLIERPVQSNIQYVAGTERRCRERID